MSESEARPAEATERESLTRLEAAVGRLVDRCHEAGARARKAEARVRDLEVLLRRFTKGDVDLAALQARISSLEEEGAELRRRLMEGRTGVERLLSQIRFLEERAP